MNMLHIKFALWNYLAIEAMERTPSMLEMTTLKAYSPVTHLVTYLTELSPSANFTATQELPSIL
jgi:hypothetical protein